jgi:hypothetical protein
MPFPKGAKLSPEHCKAISEGYEKGEYTRPSLRVEIKET